MKPMSKKTIARAPRAASLALLTLAAGLCLASSAAGQTRFAQPGQLRAIDARARAAVVDSVTAAIDSIYVLGDAAHQITARLRDRLASGAYDAITDPAVLAQRLEAEAQAVHHDGHFGIRALPPADSAARHENRVDPREVERQRRNLRAVNFGFQRTEVLPGNVGYLKLNRFAAVEDDPAAGEAAAAALGFLANTDALILDLRENGGGSASMIRLLAGYLFQESTHLIDWDIRAEKKTVQSWSADHVPGRRLADVPVYVLTSHDTFSAAEEFSFDLQHLKRATIVGDTTGGGGHTVETVDFAYDGFRVRTRLPHGRAYDPKTGKGWEGIGIIPDLPVASAQALVTAHAAALKRRLEREQDEERRAVLQWVLRGLESERTPVRLTLAEKRAYVGTFGPRRVFLRGDSLWYQREERPPFPLGPMGGDLFSLGGLETTRMGFERDARGRVVRIVGYYRDGRKDEHERTRP